MQRTKQEIIEFFQEFIFGFIYHDIERCIEARANYVVALALLSYTEYLGSLIIGDLGLLRASGANFDRIIKEYFPIEYWDINSKLKLEYTDKDGKKKEQIGIYSFFRCGLVHEYFIKGALTKGATTEVNNNPDGHIVNTRIGIEILGKDPSKKFVFYTNEYFRDFKSAVDKIYKLLILDCNPALLEGFNKSLDRLSQRKIL